jgi:hypothetical protein
MHYVTFNMHFMFVVEKPQRAEESFAIAFYQLAEGA